MSRRSTRGGAVLAGAECGPPRSERPIRPTAWASGKADEPRSPEPIGGGYFLAFLLLTTYFFMVSSAP